jgi:hypothetical protein
MKCYPGELVRIKPREYLEERFRTQKGGISVPVTEAMFGYGDSYQVVYGDNDDCSISLLGSPHAWDGDMFSEVWSEVPQGEAIAALKNGELLRVSGGSLAGYDEGTGKFYRASTISYVQFRSFYRRRVEDTEEKG